MADTENVRARVKPELADRWRVTIDARKITQQAALESLLGWIVEQDSLTQAMIFGQVEEADRAELSRIVLRRLADSGKAKRAKA